MMPNLTPDKTISEESFFFCEYAKRRFEVSPYNNGEIEKSINIAGLILESYYKDSYNVPYPMKMDLLSDAIIACEGLGLNEFAIKFRCHRVETRKITLKHLAEQISLAINQLDNIGNLLNIACRFNVLPSFLPFPYNMKDIILNIVSNGQLPEALKFRNIEERKCVVMDCNNYILFLANKHMSLEETIQELARQATLFKSNNDYENSEKPEILNDIYKELKSGEYRHTSKNAYYKLIGILLYDLCVINKCSLESAIDELMRMQPEIKCGQGLTSTDDCNRCKKFGKCRSLWNKQFLAAVNKIKGTESQEDWLKIAKEAPQKKCDRRPVSFFEYSLGKAPTHPENKYHDDSPA